MERLDCAVEKFLGMSSLVKGSCLSDAFDVALVVAGVSGLHPLMIVAQF